MDIRIFAPDEMIETQITLPLSKSMSNRALIMNALTPASAPLSQVAECDDTASMQHALASEPVGEINIGAAGTAMRFLTAYYAATPGADVLIDGVERMRHRPIGTLVDTLRQCGAEIEYAGEEGFPPLRIKGKRLHGADLEVNASVSSQFLSALLMVAPTFDSPLNLTLKGDIASEPYLMMTISMMQRRGISIVREYSEIHVMPGTYLSISAPDVERDWSAATYWYTIAALSAGWITLPGLKQPSLQGDSRVAQIFEKLGVVTGEDEDGNIELSASPEVYSHLSEDMSDCPDMVQTVVVACCMLGVRFKLTGVASLRIKETDRLEALSREALKVGCRLEIEGDDVIKWDGKRLPILELPVIDTYNDHRMAMAFAPVAQYISGIIIKDCEVVAKSYPGFWDDMRHAGYMIQDASIPIEPEAE